MNATIFREILIEIDTQIDEIYQQIAKFPSNVTQIFEMIEN